jgi:Ricin-type beta-trefoil lectin domain
MRNIKRVAIAAAACGLLAGVTFTAFTVMSGTANAGVAGSCPGAGTPISCTITDLVIPQPQSIELHALVSPAGHTVSFTWTAVCSLNAKNVTTSGGTSSTNTGVWDTVTLGMSSPDSCLLTATASLPGTSSTSAAPVPTLELDADYAPQPGTGSSPSPSATPTPVGITGLISGFAGKCVDDAGNSSALRAKVEIWTCNRGDKAQPWKYASGELMHNGLCLNAKGSGGNRSKIILWTCERSPNETWIYELNHTYKLKAHGWTLCLDDPGNSAKNGTQLIVYTCHNTPNQHWSLP